MLTNFKRCNIIWTKLLTLRRKEISTLIFFFVQSQGVNVFLALYLNDLFNEGCFEILVDY